MAAAILCELALVMAWVNYFKDSHWLSFFNQASAHSRASDEIVLNLVGVVLPLATIVSLGVVKDKLGLPWDDLLAILVVKPSVLSRHFAHFDCGGDSIFRVLL